MAWIFEQPVFILVIGLSTVVILGWLWLQTGRKIFVIAVAAAAVLTTLGMLVERNVRTDREQIEATLHEIARAVERNDLQAVLDRVDPQAARIRQVASAELPRYEFEAVKIKPNLKITVRDDDPLAAEAEFNVVVIASGGGLAKQQRVPRFVVVEFRKVDDRWLAVSYRHSDPRDGFKRRD